MLNRFFFGSASCNVWILVTHRPFLPIILPAFDGFAEASHCTTVAMLVDVLRLVSVYHQSLGLCEFCAQVYAETARKLLSGAGGAYFIRESFFHHRSLDWQI